MAEETLPAPALTPETLAELERLDREATKGPWRAKPYPDGKSECAFGPIVVPYEDRPYGCQAIVLKDNPVIRNGELWDHWLWCKPADMALLTALRNHAPDLLSAARRTQQAEAERDACASALARAMRGNKERVDDMEALVTSMEQLAAERDAALKRAEDLRAEREQTTNLIEAVERWAAARRRERGHYDLKGDLQMEIRQCERDLEDAYAATLSQPGATS